MSDQLPIAGVPVGKNSAYLEADAVFWSSPSNTCYYRYKLWRVWDRGLPGVLFVMLNPSSAGAEDDPTIRRCVGFARAWGFGRLMVVNLFALVSSDPASLAVVPDPVGSSNDEFIREAVRDCLYTTIVAAWGAHPRAAERAKAVCQIISTPEEQRIIHCITTTKGGYPGHPLYLPKHLTPALWDPAGVKHG